MKNKILIGIIILLVSLLISVRFVFKNQFDEFKISVQNYENDQLVKFDQEKEKMIAGLAEEGLSNLFNKYFDETKSFIEKDTTFSVLYLSGNVKYKTAQTDYLDCLHKKCVIEKHNEATQIKIGKKEKELERKFENIFTLWYPRLKDERLIQTTNVLDGCSDFFTDLSEISFDETAWIEFEQFMTTYDNEIKSAQIQNEKAETQFSNNVSSTKSRLRSGVIDYFNTQLSNNKSKILTEETENRVFNSTKLGIINYYLTKTNFNKDAFDNVVDDVYEEQWKYNSLRTGSMPYSSCYGSSNSCNSWGCSQIRVRTDGSNDVLVTIKNRDGNVIRHGYIEGGYSYTFNLPDGSYQVFFYSGNGWNPHKKMNSTSCSSLNGGFVSNEYVSKDNYISLYNEIITYELILQEYGNFNTKPSSINEAL